MDETPVRESFDVVVVGGGSAGLSAAVALARFRRSVLLLDAGEPRNASAGHVHNFLTRDGTPPREIVALGRAELESYGGRVRDAHVRGLRRDGEEFVVDIADDAPVRARRLVLATGLRDQLPDIPGLAQHWGSDVLHCPYCHGWEVRDRRIGILSTGPVAAHQALLFRQLSDRVTLLAHTGPTPEDDQREQLHALGIAIVPGEVVAVESEETGEAGNTGQTAEPGLTGVRLADGSRVELDALVVAPAAHARAELVEPLGLATTPFTVGDHQLGSFVGADPTGRTAVPGVWVAGNVADVQSQVVSAAAAGLAAGAAVNADLIAEDARRAVQDHRHRTIVGEAAWDERYRSRSAIWSGEPNAVLVAEVADRTPGTALDAGAGEGADACWLASRGWRVTGTDVSSVALERAAAHAANLGVQVDWQHRDLVRDPPSGTYDLVSGFFLHLPVQERAALFGHLADAVAPGGTLLVVGHDPSDADVVPRARIAEMGWTAGELAGTLGAGWQVEVAEARARSAKDPEGREVTIHDAVLRARRTGPA